MDSRQFDALVRSLGRAASRRGTLAALLAGLVGSFLPDLDLALAKRGQGKGRHGDGRKKRKGGKDSNDHRRDAEGGSIEARGRGKNANRGHGKNPGPGKDRRKHKGKNKKQKPRSAGPAQAEAACYPGSPCLPGPGKNLGKCDFSGGPALKDKNLKGANLGGATVARGDASGANLQGANLDKTCLVDTILTGALINGSTNMGTAIVCRATMPDGSTSNAGCNRGTPCCPTCDAAHPCPNGQVCCQGRCRSGDCCSDAQCPDPAEPICLNHRCSPCTTNRQCGNGRVCCGGQCESGNCCTAGDCADRACQTKSCPANQCVYEPVSNDTPCDADGNACTRNDACQSGSCVAGQAVVCTASDTCHLAGTCDPATGVCSNPSAPDGTACGPSRECRGGTCIDCGGVGQACCSGGGCGDDLRCNAQSGFCEVDCDVCPSGCNYTTLQAAVAGAPVNSTIRICPGTYATNDVTVTHNLTIVGAGSGVDGTVLDAQRLSRVLVIEGGNVVIRDLTVRGGRAGSGGGSGIRILGGALTLERVLVTGNADDELGGGIMVGTSEAQTASLVVRQSRIEDNSAGRFFGGGIYISRDGSNVTLDASRVERNTGSHGGGIWNDPGSFVNLINGSVVTGNTAFGPPPGGPPTTIPPGGGILNRGTVTLSGGSGITGNTPTNCDNEFFGTGCPA